MRVVVAGCGDVGLRLARRLRDGGHQVLALRRSPIAAEPGLESRAVDVLALQPSELAHWRADAAVSLLAPDQRDAEGYRRAFGQAPLRLHAALDHPARWLVVTSTAVMGGGADGGWIDETTCSAPDAWNGRLLAEIEAELQQRLPGLVLARPSGLYGPGREWMLRRARAGDSGDGHYTNRIHVDDCAAALAHLLSLPSPAPVYALSDDAPAPECAVLAFLRAQLQLPPLPAPSAIGGGRRISNRRLRDSGFALAYPDFRAGYAALLASAAHRL